MILYEETDNNSNTNHGNSRGNSAILSHITAPEKSIANPYMGDKCTLCNLNPTYKTKLYQRKDTGWKSISGWINEANKERTLLLLNEELSGNHYTYEMTIAIMEQLTEKQIQKQWFTIRRTLHKYNVIAYWRIETTKANKVHWHLTFRSNHDMNQIQQSIKRTMKYKSSIEWQPITNSVGWIGYMLKCKTAKGCRKDISIHDRVLFNNDVKLRRNGTIGKFWVQPKQSLNAIRLQRIAQWHNDENEKYLGMYPHLKQQIEKHIKDDMNKDEQRQYYATQLRKAQITGVLKELWQSNAKT